jgi:UDP-N-acetyl-D-galactosamine dehydrogenase
MNINNLKIAVLGLGYVGLPLALALARQFQVTGFDVNTKRVNDLAVGIDSNGETPSAVLRSTTLTFTDVSDNLAGHDIFIVTVPTPITDDYKPDLGYVESATKIVANYMKKGAIVVYESTVYPGVTEDICGPLLEKISGLICGKDFHLGYSPERINPGDTEHTIETVTKIVAGQTPYIAEILAKVYGCVNGGNIFVATDIKTAEAAKVIENAQRDINIAFINEVTMILSRMNISAYNVLEAAGTKWNFLKFTPGFVGGHCIGVDPYYLTHAASKTGYQSKVILSGRSINEDMPAYLAEQIHDRIQDKMNLKKARILVLGITFKENVSDIRNSKIVLLVNALKAFGHDVSCHDPHADFNETKAHLGIDLLTQLHDQNCFDCVVAAVSHTEYKLMGQHAIESLLIENGLIADIKNMWSQIQFSEKNQYWLL